MTGILVQSFARFPGFPLAAVPNPARPLAVFRHLWAVETKAVLLVLLAIGVFELTAGRQVCRYVGCVRVSGVPLSCVVCLCVLGSLCLCLFLSLINASTDFLGRKSRENLTVVGFVDFRPF